MHAWLYSCARQLHAHWQPSQIFEALQSACRGVGRYVPDREIRDAVNNSQSTAWTRDGAKQAFQRGDFVERDSATVAERWPKFCPAMRDARIADALAAGACFDRFEDDDCDDVIDDLFPGVEWLCLASGHPATARSRRREKWLFEAGRCDLIVPSPMTGPSGKRLDGKLSHRCLENTGERRWLVIEFDSGTMREQAALHWHFAECSSINGWPRLKLVVFSGMKSLHGWYGPVGSEDVARTMMEYAVIHGADTATWTRCQLVRLPGGLRRIPSAKISLPDWGIDWPVNFEERQRILHYAQ